jgi:hypothetical protein
MPTVKLDVSVCVIVVEPTVVPHAVLETAGLADAANDVEIVKVAAAVLTADRTRSIADFDSFVLVKSELVFNPIKSALIKLLQLLNILDAFVQAAKLNNGTVCKLEQFWNILVAFVQAAKLNNGTVCKLEQALNILVAVVQAAKLNNGTVCKLVQPWNILVAFVQAAKLNNGTVCKLGQLWNILGAFVQAAKLNNGTVCKL